MLTDSYRCFSFNFRPFWIIKDRFSHTCLQDIVHKAADSCRGLPVRHRRAHRHLQDPPLTQAIEMPRLAVAVAIRNSPCVTCFSSYILLFCYVQENALVLLNSP